ncbi:MAG: OmpH family outer membrane protein, partial [Phycisphaerae bacterium]
MQNFKKILTVAVLAVVLTGALSLRSQTRAADEPPPVRIAVVNIVKVFNALDAKKTGDTDFELIGKQLQKERDAREDELNNLKKEQMSYNPDSQEFRDTSEKMMKKAMELDSFTRYMREKMLLEGRIRTAALYRSMNKAIEEFSKASGIGLVLSMD